MVLLSQTPLSANGKLEALGSIKSREVGGLGNPTFNNADNEKPDVRQPLIFPGN